MAKVSISDVGLDFAGNEKASLSKYFSGFLKLRSLAGNGNPLAALLDLKLSEVPLAAAHIGFNVEQQVAAGNNGEWTISGGANAALRLWNKPGDVALSSQRFGPETALTVSVGQAYLSFGLKAHVTSGVSHALSGLTLGFSAGVGLDAAYYLPLPASETLRSGLEKTFQTFTLPGDLEDLAQIPAGAATSVTSSGGLQFKLSGAFSTSANPIAIDIPVIDRPLSVKTGASVGFAFDAEFRGEYEIRVVALGESKISLGVYSKQESDFEVTVSASAGASASVAGQDLTNRLLGALAGTPEVDRDFLTKAGLSAARIADLERVVSGAVQKKLEASLSLGFGRLRSNDAAFLYTIDLAALDAVGQRAVSDALDGDLRPITAAGFTGIHLERSIAIERTARSRKLRVNLFGIFNFTSLLELVREGKEVFEPDSGELFFFDKATAERRKALIDNTRRISTDKVAKLMADSFVISTAYRAMREEGGAEIAPTSQHWYFEYARRTNREQVKDHYDVAAALGFLAASAVETRLKRQRYGRTALLVEMNYDAAISRQLFFRPDGSPRPQAEFVAAGRKAVGLLETGDRVDGDLGLLGSRDDVFNIISRAGTRENAVRDLGAVTVNGNTLSEPIRHAMYGNYLAIEWWADAMAALAAKLDELNRFRNSLPPASDPQMNNSYKKLRGELRAKLAEVAERTKPMFGEPWGLIAMDQASGQKAEARIQITTDDEIYENERDGSASATAA